MRPFVFFAGYLRVIIQKKSAFGLIGTKSLRSHADPGASEGLLELDQSSRVNQNLAIDLFILNTTSVGGSRLEKQ